MTDKEFNSYPVELQEAIKSMVKLAVKAEEKQSEVCENCDERYTSVSGLWGNRKYCKIDGHRIENSKRYGCIDFRRKEGKDG